MEWSTQVIEIGDQISALTPTKAAELLAYLKDTYNIEPAFGQPSLEPQIEKKVEQKPPEQTEWAVILESYDPNNKVGLVKTYREISGLGLKDSMAGITGTSGGTPLTIKEGLPKAEAEKLKALLEANGGKASLK